MRGWPNQARHGRTGRIHECHDLESLPDAKDGGWVCPDERCAVPLIPCAWEPDKQPKKAPYFRTGKGQPHKPDCFIHGLEQLSVEGQKRRISTDGGFPVAYPSRVILAPRRVTAENAGDYCKEMELTRSIRRETTCVEC